MPSIVEPANLTPGHRSGEIAVEAVLDPTGLGGWFARFGWRQLVGHRIGPHRGQEDRRHVRIGSCLADLVKHERQVHRLQQGVPVPVATEAAVQQRFPDLGGPVRERSAERVPVPGAHRIQLLVRREVVGAQGVEPLRIGLRQAVDDVLVSRVEQHQPGDVLGEALRVHTRVEPAE
nr:hypothetical protein [Saccharopolyspora terrae]